ncbi:helix-turn-helix domain-containing protein [Halomonas sp.]|uniref:helix-turn-helix transcriptional regulator n=1 Tax=Halomonas sp. TaxID=1486246 RepID=UPI003D0EEACD
MPLAPRLLAHLDDIRLWQMPPARMKALPPPCTLHDPHTQWLLVPRDGRINVPEEGLESDTTPLLLGPTGSQVVALEGAAIALEVPSYRLGVSPLTGGQHRLLEHEQGHLVQALLEELTLRIERISPESQRYIAQAISDLLYCPAPALGETGECSLLAEADTLMRRRLAEHTLRAEDIAQAMGMSRAGLYRVLTPCGGFKTCLHALRLDRVAQLLRNPQQDHKAIKGLLFHNGFSSTEQFQRLFRQRFGVAARAFRKGALSPLLGDWRFEALPGNLS